MTTPVYEADTIDWAEATMPAAAHRASTSPTLHELRVMNHSIAHPLFHYAAAGRARGLEIDAGSRRMVGGRPGAMESDGSRGRWGSVRA